MNTLFPLVGTMALLDIPASVSSQIIPALLLTVGVCGTIHLLTLVYRKIDEGAGTEDAVAEGREL